MEENNSELTVSEAAELVSYTERHIRRLAKNKSIKARQVGDWLYLVDKDSLLAYADRMKALGSEKHAPGG